MLGSIGDRGINYWVEVYYSSAQKFQYSHQQMMIILFIIISIRDLSDIVSVRSVSHVKRLLSCRLAISRSTGL